MRKKLVALERRCRAIDLLDHNKITDTEVNMVKDSLVRFGCQMEGSNQMEVLSGRSGGTRHPSSGKRG